MSGTFVSPWSTESSVPFTDDEKAAIRDFAGYPLYGNGTVVFPMPWVNKYYLALELRLNSMQGVELQKARYWLGQLQILDDALPTAGGNLDTDAASVWTHNKNEVKDRDDLFNRRRRRLCQFLGVPPGPGMTNSSGNTIDCIV